MNIADDHPNEAHKVEIVPWLLRKLWKNRNDFCFKGLEYGAREIVKKAEEDGAWWKKRKEDETEERTRGTFPREVDTAKWRQPPHGWLKCNTDEAWSEENQISGLGWCLRDSFGEVKWMGARSIPKARSVLETEAEALRWAILSI